MEHRWSTDGGVAYERWRASPSILPTECVHSEGPRMGSSYGLSSPTWESSPGLVHQPWSPRCPIPTLRSWEKSPLTKRNLCHGSARVSPWEDSAWKSFSQQEAPFLPKKTGGKWYFLNWRHEHFNTIHFNKARSSGILERNIFSTVGHAEAMQLTETLPRILYQLKADKMTWLMRPTRVLSRKPWVRKMILFVVTNGDEEIPHPTGHLEKPLITR